MSLDAIMLAHPSVQDLDYKAELVSHDASPLAIAGYRLRVALLARFGRMDSRHDGIRSAPSCTMSRYNDESVESVLAIPIRMRASS